MDKALTHNGHDALHSAMSLIPSGVFVLTAAFENRRDALLVKRVQVCSTQPPMVLIALPLGRSIEPLIRDSGCFALCQIAETDRFLRRRLNGSLTPGDDPLLAMLTATAMSGSPIIDRALSYLDCELARHLDIEGDCGLFIGRVIGGGILHHDKPAVTFGVNGTADHAPTPTRRA